MDPPRAFTDLALIVRVEVPDLRPALRVDVAGGSLAVDLRSVNVGLVPQDGQDSARVPLETVDWDAAGYVWARTVPGTLPEGPYTVDLIDPRGQHAGGAPVFVSLGPDTIRPSIVIEPDLPANSILAEGSIITRTIIADDGFGRLQQVRWDIGDGASVTCPPSEDVATTPFDPRYVPPSQIKCLVQFQVPTFSDLQPSILPFQLHAVARDLSGNEGILDIGMRIARRPIVTSFSDSVGALGGYQPFVVHGRGFISGTQASLGGVPIVGTVPGGDVKSDVLIVGWTPARNRPGLVRMQVSSAGGTTIADASFAYVSAPNPREVQPDRGPTAGGYRVTIGGNDLRMGAKVFIGVDKNTRQPLTALSYQQGGTNKISGCVPAGAGQVSVWVYDPVTGDGVLPLAFTYDDANGTAVPSSAPGCP